MTAISSNTKTWNKPSLDKLGTLKDVAGGSALGNDSNGNGNGNKALAS